MLPEFSEHIYYSGLVTPHAVRHSGIFCTR